MKKYKIFNLNSVPTRIALKEKLSIVETLLKDEIVLYCPVNGVPLPVISWLWNDTNIGS